jgi:hypothetical protein
MNQLVCGGLFKLFFILLFLFFFGKTWSCVSSLPVPYVLNFRMYRPSFHISVLFFLFSSASDLILYVLHLENQELDESSPLATHPILQRLTGVGRGSADEGRRSGALLVAAISARVPDWTGCHQSGLQSKTPVQSIPRTDGLAFVRKSAHLS